MKEIQEMIELRKKQILELKSFVDSHREKFPPINRKSPLSSLGASSEAQLANMSEDERHGELFRYQLGDIEREVTEAIAKLNSITHELKMREDVSSKTLLEDFLTPLEIEEVDKCVRSNKSRLNAVKLVKELTH
jgi:hypothetical protein